MALPQRRAGLIQLQINGEVHDAKGDFTYSPGTPKRTGIIGSDRPHGFSETPQIPYIEGKITDRGTLDLRALFSLEGATVTISLANGKAFVLSDAYYAGDATATTNEGE